MKNSFWLKGDRSGRFCRREKIGGPGPGLTGVFLFVGAVFFCGAGVFAQGAFLSDLEKAKWYYQHESYEESIGILKELRTADPGSSEIAFYTGLTYKKMQDYGSAKPHLIDAVSLSPKIEAALPELIDLLYQCNMLSEAKYWIGEAEKAFVAPAQVAFFKGLVFLKENIDLDSALKAFEDSARLDPSLEQSVNYQKGLIYAQQKKFDQARGVFRQIVVKDPAADLAAYANEYIDAIARGQEAGRRMRGSVGYALQYDDNVVFKPNDQALSTDVSSESDIAHVMTAQAEYSLISAGRAALKFGYSGYSSRHDDIGYYDIVSHDFPVQPVLYFEKSSFAFPLHYNYVSVNDQRYMEIAGAGNQSNIMLDKNLMAQFQFQYNFKDYRWPASAPDERKDGHEYTGAAGLYRFFSKNNEGFVSLRYAANYEDTRGRNWKYSGNRLTFSAVVPVKRSYKWNFVADYFRQDFAHRNSSYDKPRRDNIVTCSNLFSWEPLRGTQLYLQHTFVYDGASIGIYKYRKNVYSIGTQYRF